MLPNNWLTRTVGDLITLQRGIDLPDAERRPGRIPIMGSFGITGRHDKPACKGPGVTVGRSGASIGVVCYIGEDFWPLNTCLYVRDFHGNNPRFVYYFLRTLDLARLNSGSAQPSLNRNFVHPVPVSYPPRAEQDVITSILGALDDKIDLNRRMNETLEATARAIFKDWFVDFGPTRAKMEGRAPYLAPEIWSLFPDRMDNEGKPEGWEFQPLSAFMSFRGGSQPPANQFVNQLHPDYVRLLQIRDFDSDAHITFVPKTERLRIVGCDDICIGRYGSGTGEAKDSLGRLCRGLTGAINVALVVVKPLFDCREYLATYIGAGDFRRDISGGSARAVQAGFRKEDLDHIKMTRAPNAVHQAFEGIGQLVWRQSQRSASESETLAATRDLLLPKLMSGEIRVKDAERIAEAAK